MHWSNLGSSTGRKVSVLFLSLLLINVTSTHAENASAFPSEFEIYLEEFQDSKREPEAWHSLRGFHCTFRKQRRPMTQPAQFTILIEKYRRGRLNYTTRWVSIGLSDVISVEGHRYQLAKISGGNTRLLFKLDDKSADVAKPNTICIPHSGEAAIEKFSVIWESGDDSNRMAVAQMRLTDAQLSPLVKNNPYLAVGDLIPRQQYSKNRSDAVRVEAKEGNDLIVGDQRYTISRVVEPDPKEGVVGWIEISKSSQ